MSFSPLLQQAIENELDQIHFSELVAARKILTQRYRHAHQEKSRFMQDAMDRLAYLAARMPATYAANTHVLREIRERWPDFLPKSLLDLGAGPGTASWAASDTWSELTKITLVERDPHLIALGKKLASHSAHSALQHAEWKQHDLEKLHGLGPYDCSILSYSLGEIPETHRTTLLDYCIASAETLVIIEPGTPIGFKHIYAARTYLIEHGYHIVAPCPHQMTCPMSGTNWCHFPARVDRTSLHRRIKDGTLGYEDEKFSYIVASRQSCMLPEARIVCHPQRHSGHIRLTLCTATEGIVEKLISKRTPDQYKKTRKVSWGESWPPPSPMDRG